MKRIDCNELLNIQKNMGLLTETIADLRIKKEITCFFQKQQAKKNLQNAKFFYKFGFQ